MASIETLARKDGRPAYKVRWYVNGRRGVRTFSEESDHEKAKADAIAYRALLERNETNPERTDRLYREAKETGPTLTEVLHTHVKQLTNVGKGQIARYEKSIPAHFAGIGQIRVVNLTQADVKAWVQRMEGAGYSPKTVSNHKGFLAAALNTAVSHQLISHNPTKGVKVSTGLEHEEKVHYITGEQWKQIVGNMAPHYVPFFQFLLASGCRFGEATALTPADFDLTGPTALVRISKAWKEDGTGGHVLGPPKTRKGRRTVSIPAATMSLLEPLLVREKDALVFTTTQGNRILSSLAHKVWGPACEKAGLTGKNKPRIHSIRHGHAAIMLHAGMDMYALSRRLGHASIQMSIDLYSDLMPDAHFEGANVATKALENFQLP